MGSVSDFQHPSLLPAGLHCLDIGSIQTTCVGDFPSSTTRAAIFAGLESLIAEITNLSLPCVLWVDGSFLSKKEDPADVDLLAWLPPEAVQNKTPDQDALMLRLSQQAYKPTHKCDTRVLPGYGPMFIGTKKTWLGYWGFDYWDQAKGIAVIELGAKLEHTGAVIS